MYSVEGWPSGTEPAADKNKSKSKKGGKNDGGAYDWLCPACAHSGVVGEQVVGRAVKVWWKDDAQFYCGTVNAYDTASGKHRVLYDDGEWEFIDIGVEPVLTDMEPPIDPTVKEKSDNRAGRKR